MKEHKYTSKTIWTGNTGSGTHDYKSYERSYNIMTTDKPTIVGSADPAFRGDKTKHNPEDFLLSSLSSCHMLWYLHFCAVNNIVVTSYIDHAEGTMIEENSGKGRFTEVVLNPEIVVADKSMIQLAIELHIKANEYCFIANSVNFPVRHNPTVTVRQPNFTIEQ